MSDDDKAVGDDLYTGLSTLSNYVVSRIQEGEYSYETNKEVLDVSRDQLGSILKEGLDYGAPQIFKDMAANGDIDNLVSMFLYGAPIEVYQGMFGPDGTATELPGSHNVFITNHSSNELNELYGGSGGLFGAWAPTHVAGKGIDSGAIASIWGCLLYTSDAADE